MGRLKATPFCSDEVEKGRTFCLGALTQHGATGDLGKIPEHHPIFLHAMGEHLRLAGLMVQDKTDNTVRNIHCLL